MSADSSDSKTPEARALLEITEFLRSLEGPGGLLSIAEKITSPRVQFVSKLGIFTISWAAVESTLDMWIAIIFFMLGGNSIEPERPISLRRKLKFIRKCYSQIPALVESKQIAHRLTDRVDDLRESRHFLIHGVVQVSDAGIVVTKFEPSSSEIVVGVRDFEHSEVEAITKQSFSLAAEIYKQVNSLRQAAADKRNKSPSKL